MHTNTFDLSTYGIWDGARYLQELMDNPDQDIHCLSLIHSLDPPDPAYFRALAPEQENPKLDEYTLLQSFISNIEPIPALDPTTIKQSKQRIKWLKAKLNTALSAAQKTSYQEELSQIENYLRAGLRRDLNPELRRGYQIVQKAVKRFLQYLEKTDPELASSLQKHFTLGIYCRWRW